MKYLFVLLTIGFYLQIAAQISTTLVSIDGEQPAAGGVLIDSFRYDFEYNNGKKVLRYSLATDYITSGVLSPYSEAINTYDAANNLLGTDWNAYDLPTNSYVNAERIISTYNSEGQLTEQIGQIFDNVTGSFQNYNRQVINYNSIGIESAVGYGWSNVAFTWVPGVRYAIYYNGNDTIDQQIIEYWDGTTNDWMPEDKSTYTYNANGQYEQVLYEFFDPTIPGYVLDDRESFTYNANGLVTGMLTEVYDETTSLWEASRNTTYTNNGIDQLIAKRDFYFDAMGDLQPLREYLYLYDVHGNMIQETNNKYQSVPMAFTIDGRYDVTYDTGLDRLTTVFPNTYTYGDNYLKAGPHAPSEVVFGTSNGAGGTQMVYKASYNYENRTFTSIRSNSAVLELILYPNPVISTLYFTQEDVFDATAIIYNYQGQKVLVQEGHIQNGVELSELPGGNYIIVLENDEAIYSASFIKQ